VTAIVGPSGAGKSTLLDVVLGLYSAESGAITVGDVPISDLDHWRAHVAVVSQRVHLFHTSLADNIRYGSPQATDADVMQAAQRAHIHDFIKGLPQGYETPAGDLGGLLSAGQRQRIALARAFVRQPDVFVFDEATSALDSLTDRAVRASLSAHLDGCTVLTVTHQLAQTRKADWIVVMQNGRIEANGTFADLILQDGLFSRMYMAQDGFAHVSNTLTAATPSSDAEVLR
jgi:ABC-type multidrug transport system fused ATPase/permease subunit